MEVMDPRSFDVWLCQSPVTLDAYKAFAPEPPFMKSGIGRAAFDAAHFTRSPGALTDGPAETREIGGHEFARIARPRDFHGIAPGDAPTRVAVEKHHVITFAAGRMVRVARLPDGHDYVEHTLPKTDEPFPLPTDWSVTSRTLESDWVVVLPTPATVWFFKNLASFAGPI